MPHFNQIYSFPAFFDSPDLLAMQRSTFHNFLKQGIAAELAKKFPIKIKSGNYFIELLLNEQNFQLLAPVDDPKHCILKMKTYSCKLYVQAQAVWKNSSGKIVYRTKPEWVLLCQLPIMTKRGHFIVNGSPRVIVHQVVRSPGIYFHKIFKKDSQNRARFYGDVIPLKGVWVRLEITKKGRVDARFKKGKKVRAYFLQKCLEQLEHQFVSKETSFFRQDPISVLKPLTLPDKVSTKKSYKNRCFLQTQLFQPVSNSLAKRAAIEGLFLANSSYMSCLGERATNLQSKSVNLPFVRTYDQLYRTIEDKEFEVEEWREERKNLFSAFSKIVRDFIIYHKYKAPRKKNIKIYPEKPFKRKKCSENLFATFKMASRYDLGELGRAKINSKLNLFEQEKQLTALDIASASTWLSKLRRGEENVDDIDHSQNRRVRSSGELLQIQFENGVDRLKNLLVSKLKESSNTLHVPTFSSQWHQKHIGSPNQLTSGEHGATLQNIVLARKNLLVQKPSFVLFNKTQNVSFKGKSQALSSLPKLASRIQGDQRAPKKLLTRRCFSKAKITSGFAFQNCCIRQNKISFVSQKKKTLHAFNYKYNKLDLFSKKTEVQANRQDAMFLYSGKETELSIRNLFSAKPITGALREFFGSNPLSQYMDQTNPLAEITHKRRISSLGIGGVSRASAGMAIRGIHPTHYGRICPIETPEGKNAGLVNSVAFYTKMDKNGFLKSPYYQVFKGQVQSELGFSFYSAKKESTTALHIAPSDLQQSWARVLRTNFGKLDSIPVRVADNLLDVFKKVTADKVQCIGISPIQMISAATSLIPFLEHNDANRALMGSNMQRQAVPLMISERPIIGTGLESLVLVESGHITQSKIAGFVSYVSAGRVVVERLLPIKADKKLHNIAFLPFSNKKTESFFEKKNVLRCVPQTYTNSAIVLHRPTFSLYKETNLALKKMFLKRDQQTSFEKTFEKGLSLQNSNSYLRNMFSKNRLARFVSAKTWRKTGLSLSLQGCNLNQRFAIQKQSFSNYKPVPYKSKAFLAHNFYGYLNNSGKLITEHVLLDKESFRYKKQKLCSTRLNLVRLHNSCMFWNVNSAFITAIKKSCYIQKHNFFRAKSLVCFPRNIQKQLESTTTHCVHSLKTFNRSNQNTCILEKPLVQESDWVQKGDLLSDCSASQAGELAVGKNLVIAYIPWEGYNFEDAIVISERLIKQHVYSSLHIERYVFQAQDLKEENEWFTNQLPGVAKNLIQHLEKSGLPKIGSFLKQGDLLVGKVRYVNKKPTSPYERLLRDILGDKDFSSRNKSFYVPKGVEARVINHRITSIFQKPSKNKIRPIGAAKTVHIFLGEKRAIQVGDKMSGRHGNKGVISTVLPVQDMPYLPDGTSIDLILNPLGVPSRMNVGQVLECLLGLACTYLHQNLKTTAFDEVYGVEASKSLVYLKLYQARLQSGQNWLFQANFPGKTRLVDGRSGECFDQWITVGKAYMLKLIHMVSEKIHARSTGPYALITQQPLRGRSNRGGQRLGEMEVWALQGFGAAYTLQELLTKKSDDFNGREGIFNSIMPAPPSIFDIIEPSVRVQDKKEVLGQPEIFKVLLCELQALCLDVGVYVLKAESFQRTFLELLN